MTWPGRRCGGPAAPRAVVHRTGSSGLVPVAHVVTDACGVQVVAGRVQGPGGTGPLGPTGVPRPRRTLAAMNTDHLARRVWATWLTGWSGMLVLALANGTLRALVVQPAIGEEAARRVATVTLLVVLTGYVRWLHRRWPIPTARQAWAVGSAWAGLTLAFEFGWGGLVEGLPLSTMLADYDVTAGRIWVLVPIWTAAAPAVVRRLQRTRTAERVGSR